MSKSLNVIEEIGNSFSLARFEDILDVILDGQNAEVHGIIHLDDLSPKERIEAEKMAEDGYVYAIETYQLSSDKEYAPDYQSIRFARNAA